MKNNITRFLFISVITALLFAACQKSGIEPLVYPDNSNPDLTSKVHASISGFVTDENNVAMQDAIIRVGNAFVNTDQYGYFEIKNVEFSKTAATFSISKNEYFKLTKTFMANEGKSSFFRIKLTHKTIIGTINATNGGDVSLINGTMISLPVESVKNASTGVGYTGVISVSAHYIDPTAADIAGILPGDLRGLRTNGDLNVLDSYGMLEVELTGASGELLQIADGKKATLSMAIPSSLTATAPATIPLWYFDETTGLWKEEGSANKVGNQYVGEVAHFSTWNCDNPKPHVPYHCRLVYSDGSPAANVEVKLIEENYYGGGTNHGFTDANGEIFGGVQANTQVRMEVNGVAFSNCSIYYNATFSTTGAPLDMGNLTVNAPAAYAAHVSGTLKNCDNSPVTNGRVIYFENNQYQLTYTNSNGEFNYNTVICFSIPSVFFAQDLNNNAQATPVNFTLNPGNNIVNPISFCPNNVTTITANNQVWMNRNIDVDHYQNGDPIPQITDPAEWANLTTGAWCYYGNDSINGVIYGKLYNWYAVTDPRGLAPQGWHVPSISEWNKLIKYVDPNSDTSRFDANISDVAGGYLKANAGWNSPNSGAIDLIGFSALGAGYRDEGGVFNYLGQNCAFWNSTISTNTYDLYMDYQNTVVGRYFWPKKSGFSVRCLKD